MLAILTLLPSWLKLSSTTCKSQHRTDTGQSHGEETTRSHPQFEFKSFWISLFSATSSVRNKLNCPLLNIDLSKRLLPAATLVRRRYHYLLSLYYSRDYLVVFMKDSCKKNPTEVWPGNRIRDLETTRPTRHQ